MRAHQVCLLGAILLFECRETQNAMLFPSNLMGDVLGIIYGYLPTRNLITSPPVTVDNIKYYLFSDSSRPETYIKIDASNADLLNRSNPVVFLIHGWTQNRKTQWYELIKNAFFVRDRRYQIIQSDWSVYSKRNYFTSQNDTKDVGDIMGHFIVSLVKNYSVPLENFLIVGHSLGGQIAGFLGKKVFQLLGKKLTRIVALDPAGPLFEGRPPEERLAPTDADVVHVIHTSGGFLGYEDDCGTADFRPNGGRAQPGCVPEITVAGAFCNHHRSWWFFIEGIQESSKFKAKKCSNYEKFKSGGPPSHCSNETVEMCSLQITKRGQFYLDTNGYPPYSK